MFTNRSDFKKNTWRLLPELRVPDLQLPVVLFSLFDSDPRPKYRDIFQSASKTERPPTPGAVAGVDPRLIRHGQLSALWDSLFRDVPGDKMSFLYCTPAAKAKSKRGKARGVAMPSVATMLASNDAPGTKWLVTRAILHEGRSVCWCLPVTVSTGKTTKIRLTPRNMMELEPG